MKNLRTWGKKPYKVAVVHGGPGAPGYMAPVARELSKTLGVLEPLQTKDSIDGQIEELADILKKNADVPGVLIGHSWGATLSYMTAARHPDLIKRLILIGTVPLEGKDMPDYTPVWLDRLSEKERVDFISLQKSIWDGVAEDKNKPFGQLIRLVFKAESYAQVRSRDEVLQFQFDINMAIGLEIQRFLADGGFLESSRQVNCPVVAIHGDYDPRPAALVQESLSHAYKDFKFFLLDKCGHFPWMERYAREKFFEVLREEIA